MVLNIYNIVANDEAERWEFTPKAEDSFYPSYSVKYADCDNKADACIAVYEALKEQGFIDKVITKREG